MEIRKATNDDLPALLALFAAGTALGAVVGAKFLKKHVRKAKIA